MLFLRPLCQVLGHKYTQIHDQDILEWNTDGDPILGPGYIDHYWCTRCDKIKRA